MTKMVGFEAFKPDIMASKLQGVLPGLVFSRPGWLRKIPDTPTECCTELRHTG